MPIAQRRRLGLAALLAWGCTRARASGPVPPHTAEAPTHRICAALERASPLSERFVDVLPLELGGVLVTLDGVSEAEVLRALSNLGLAPTSLTACETDRLVLFISGVSVRNADTLLRRLQEPLPTARIRDSAPLAPRVVPSRGAAAAPSPSGP